MNTASMGLKFIFKLITNGFSFPVKNILKMIPKNENLNFYNMTCLILKKLEYGLYIKVINLGSLFFVFTKKGKLERRPILS